MALDRRHQDLLKQGDELLNKRSTLLSLWQEVADHFYPERADFTAIRSLGQDFAGNLATSYPLIARRTLGNIFASMLRSDDWFAIRCAQETREDNQAKKWLEWASGVQRRAMYDKVTNFVRATKEGDHDYAAFGQCVLWVSLNKDQTALIYRCYHLRDVAWCENSEGQIDTIHRQWKPTYRDIARLFPNTVPAAITEKLSETPYAECNVRHIVISTDGYEPPAGGKKWRTPYVSLYIDVEHTTVLEEVGVYQKGYIIPRWQTVSGSQYAYSPAVVAALPDARLIQSMTLALLDAGERAARPPMLANRDAIRGDVNAFPNGVTWMALEYDKNVRDALSPIQFDKTGMPIALDMLQDVRSMISSAFFLDKLNLPPPEHQMTAYETGQRLSEWIRGAAPLFEPVISDYNGQVCEETFTLLMRSGTFGSPDNIPDSLKGQEVQFRFVSPLTTQFEKVKAQQFVEAKQMLAEAAQVDPETLALFDAKTALRDALGANVPAKWLRDEETEAQIVQANAQARKMAAAAQAVHGAATVAQQVGDAGQSIKAAVGGAAAA